MYDYSKAFAGGLIIGLAAVFFLLLEGRILGVSGIAGGLFTPGDRDKAWRFSFLLGLAAGGGLVLARDPAAFASTLSRSLPALAAAGLLVGYGTRLGGGCTSGHGVCGVSRASARSLVATLVFMACGAATVFVVNHVLGGGA